MSRPAIVVDDLSKSYRLGAAATRSNSLREALTHALTSPVRRFREAGEVREEEAQTFWALRGVSFEVQSGEVIGIIGRNGAGKSTLLKILSRIVDPTGGSIRLRGRVASLLEVGTGFHPELTGRENIYLNGSILGMKKYEIDRKFDEIVDFSGVERFLDTPVKRYSSGMYVRLAFAVAAHLEPEILIVDEVLAVGDVEFQKKCLGKMKQVTVEGGRTVLFVSHNLTSVRALCDRVIWLNGGKVVVDGAAGPAVEAYLAESLSDDEGTYDLDGHDRPSSVGSLLRLQKLTLNEGNPVRHGVPLKIEIDYRSMKDLDGVAFGLGFSSHEGARILTIDSDAPGERYAIRRDTAGRVEMTIPELQLQPGRYALDIAARSGENVNLDFLPGFAAVEVLPGPDTPGRLVGRSEAGSVRVPAISHHFPAPAAASVPVS
jgi:lipopolysaccharide transport system ATP-binding protein